MTKIKVYQEKKFIVSSVAPFAIYFSRQFDIKKMYELFNTFSSILLLYYNRFYFYVAFGLYKFHDSMSLLIGTLLHLEHCAIIPSSSNV